MFGVDLVEIGIWRCSCVRWGDRLSEKNSSYKKCKVPPLPYVSTLSYNMYYVKSTTHPIVWQVYIRVELSDNTVK